MATSRTRRRPTARARSNATGARLNPTGGPTQPEVPSQLLWQELLVHREELRAQTEKLTSVLGSLEDARDRYIELYDFAPNGYMTLDQRGVVREINLHAAALFGRDRMALIGLPVLRFFIRDDRVTFVRYLQACRGTAGGPPLMTELRIDGPHGTRLVQFFCRPHQTGDDIEFFTALVDVTDRRRLEAEREQAQHQRAELVHQMMTLQERERQRLARDIHDDLGQQVTALRLKLDWLAGAAERGGDVAAAIAGVQQVGVGLDRRIDFLLRGLRPPGLDDLGLMSALEQAVHEWSSTFGIPAEFQRTGPGHPPLPDGAEAHVYRIVQEALNNVHKHAAATGVAVAIECRHGQTVVSITDDGVGLPALPASETARRGLGLLSMRERASLIGGTLDISSAPGLGTSVTLTLPATPSPG